MLDYSSASRLHLFLMDKSWLPENHSGPFITLSSRVVNQNFCSTAWLVTLIHWPRLWKCKIRYLKILNDLMARCLILQAKIVFLSGIANLRWSLKNVSNLKVDGVTESSVRRVCITTTWAINVLSFNLVESMTISRPYRRKQVQHITHWTMLMYKLTFINFRHWAEPFHFAAFHPTRFKKKLEMDF